MIPVMMPSTIVASAAAPVPPPPLKVIAGRLKGLKPAPPLVTVTDSTPPPENAIVAVAEAPFGGIKQTGYGREGGSMAIKDYLNIKYTHFGVSYE